MAEKHIYICDKCKIETEIKPKEWWPNCQLCDACQAEANILQEKAWEAYKKVYIDAGYPASDWKLHG